LGAARGAPVLLALTLAAFSAVAVDRVYLDEEDIRARFAGNGRTSVCTNGEEMAGGPSVARSVTLPPPGRKPNAMKRDFSAAFLVAATAVAADAPGYACSMRVGNPSVDETVSNGGAKKSRTAHAAKSVKTKSRVTGCIIQLVVKGKVEKSYASNSGWSKPARSDPVQVGEVLKIR